MQVGLRVDADTLRGTLRGVPALARSCRRHGIGATFFLSLGPDNMGRHLWRLARPGFLKKMLRTRAGRLYGWDILLRGTLAPGPRIGRRAAAAIRALQEGGFETGLHAWDHHRWQSAIARMKAGEVRTQLERAAETFERVTGEAPRCSAAPAWRTTDVALTEKLLFPFAYNSDCRGEEPFLPLLDDGTLGQLQVPTTLPTYDESVGPQASADDYFDGLLVRLAGKRFAVLTVHAEVEGIVALAAFERFVERALAAGHRLVPLAELAAAATSPPTCRMERRTVAGRDGWASWQGERVASAAATAATLVTRPSDPR